MNSFGAEKEDGKKVDVRLSGIFIFDSCAHAENAIARKFAFVVVVARVGDKLSVLIHW